ncbi:MAG: ribosome recycling factor [Parcubacteria group bacterium Gr01-1014_46]|nr:MAG: ribosome recycling factor [Parcubacteria group bacterium Gr01-1014_46]
MAYNFGQFKESIKGVEEWLKKELSTIRTGRANLSILDSVKVEAYGSFMLINQVANLSMEDARTVRIAPWDASVTKDIEKAIIAGDLGLSVTVDDKGLRVIFPELTGERRVALVKLTKQKLEDAKVSLRGERERVIKDIDSKEKEGEISEDEKFRLKTELQKMLDECTRNLESLFEKKEKEISE